MAQRPLVPTTIRTEFGDVLDDPSFYDIGGADRDLTYVPGFSDMRRARDLGLAAIASGAKLKHEVDLKPLPVNLHWTRTTTIKGAPDGRKAEVARATHIAEARHVGEVAVSAADVIKRRIVEDIAELSTNGRGNERALRHASPRLCVFTLTDFADDFVHRRVELLIKLRGRHVVCTTEVRHGIFGDVSGASTFLPFSRNLLGFQ